MNDLEPGMIPDQHHRSSGAAQADSFAADAELAEDRLGLDIAIIGLAGRFPGATSLEAFWHNLQAGIESIARLTDEELIAAGVDPLLIADPDYVKASPLLDQVEAFDADFFGFTPREAELADPQQRIFLECAWEALEHAGYTPETSSGLIGVYAGGSTSSYVFNLFSNPEFLRSTDALQIGIGTNLGFLSTRVSYKLNLRGPSINLQTACSTALVGVHLACQSLLTYQCDMAVAGGASVRVPQRQGYRYQPDGIESPDGHCRAFDADAQGTVFGSGVGVVILKRLEDAINDGDYIHAVIKGSAINNDGASKVGYAAPSEDGQAAVIAAALGAAGVSAETISTVEAHGTATAVGDPIEVAALTQAFRATTDKSGFCAIGSVKTNIGHSDAAAGMMGLIKIILSLKHRQLVPSLHFHTPSPQIDWVNSPFYVNTQLRDWLPPFPRRAGVSAFGIGGTNAHVIVEEAPPRESTDEGRPWQVLVWSAKTPSALEQATTRLLDHLQQHAEQPLTDIAYTYQCGRRAFAYRRMVVCRDRQDAIAALEGSQPQRILTARSTEQVALPVVLMFPGQGSQYVSMARQLYQTEPTFRAQIDRCAELLQPQLGLDLRHLLFASNDRADEAAQQLRQTAIAQPALFVIEYALARLWEAWGVQPQALIGHSIGEYVAACLAGVFALEDALTLVVVRGQLIQQLPGGTMLSVALPASIVVPLLQPPLALAADNAPAQCVVAGPTEAIAALERQLAEQGAAYRRLHTSHAFHSPILDPMVGAFAERVATIQLSPPQIPLISNLTGTWMTAEQATDPWYWAHHVRQTVQFSAGLGELLRSTEGIVLEVGPGRTLCSLAKQQPIDESRHIFLSSLPQPHEELPDDAFILGTLGQIWLHGGTVNWTGFHAHTARQRVPVPTYPFERQRYWIEAGQAGPTLASRPSVISKHPDITTWFYVPSWQRTGLPIVSQHAPSAATTEPWLIFMDGNGLGAQLGQALQAAGHEVVTVRPGTGFTRQSERSYVIAPEQLRDYEALFDDLAARDELPHGIVHLWSLLSDSHGDHSTATFDSAQQHGLYSVLRLAQALGSRRGTAPSRLWLVSSNLHAVVGDEDLQPAHATMLGAGAVIPQEYTHLSCYALDITLAPDRQIQPLQVKQLLAELTAAPGDAVVAFRGPYRWTRSFSHIQLPELGNVSDRLRAQGCYLITGGLGRMGLLLAEELARCVKAQLILVDRAELPPRASWDDWLEQHPDPNATTRMIQVVQKIEELGGQVLIATADVSDADAMQQVLDQALSQFGTIHGLIHAAGVGEGATAIADLTPSLCAQEFEAKVGGLLLLDRLFQGQSLDFCLLLSSLASMLGGLGHAAYAAANLFMDAFAQTRRQTGSLPWTSVNWETWNLSGSQGAAGSIGHQRSLLSLTPEETRATFQRVLAAADEAQVVISTGDLHARIAQWINPSPGKTQPAQSHSSADGRHARPQLQHDYTAPTNDVEHAITGMFHEVLGIEHIGIHDSFFDLGGDSLQAVQVVARLRERFQVDLPLHNFFERPTVAKLAAVLTQQPEPTEQLDDMERLLREIESLSVEEVAVRLSEVEQHTRKRDDL